MLAADFRRSLPFNGDDDDDYGDGGDDDDNGDGGDDDDNGDGGDIECI